MVKIVAIAIVCAIIIIYLKSINSELTTLAIIGSGIIVIFSSLNYVSQTFSLINKIIEISGLNSEVYSIIFKITAIGYLFEFGAGTINDFGLSGLADKLLLAGKIIILSVSFPIIYALLNLIMGLLQ